MRISDWSSDVCSSDLWWHRVVDHYRKPENRLGLGTGKLFEKGLRLAKCLFGGVGQVIMRVPTSYFAKFPRQLSRVRCGCRACVSRSEEHTSELQSLMRISYAVFCLKTKKTNSRQYLISPRIN